MAELFTFDTNILIYSISSIDPRKHEIARQVVGTHAALIYPIPLQTLNEFYFATTRKKLIEASVASAIIHDALELLPAVAISSEDLPIAMRWHQQHDLQFFDALLIATARRAGCRIFFTEDMQNSRSIEGITLCNPFLLPPEELEKYLS
ncbi:MAG TPA: PIN domain-containing protein [Edaphobacter sp.]|nr:PIN domain-containing protein [Edaphobacter sp.]